MTANHLLSSISGFGKRLVAVNPSYLISACAVLYGLQISVAARDGLQVGWQLMSSIAGYSLLLTLACWVIVRWGQVWDDARSIFLILVFVQLALAISIDAITVKDPLWGLIYGLVGLTFCVHTSEGLLHSLSIRLGRQYRMGLYLLLGLIFLYPTCLGYCAMQEDAAWLRYMRMGVLLFPILGGLFLLSLWPAARSAGRSDAPSGTPWNWPWYPWTLFAGLCCALALRSVAISYGFEAMQTRRFGWRPYFLIPLMLASAVLVLEMAIVRRHLRAQMFATVLPLLLVVPALPGGFTGGPARANLQLLEAFGMPPIRITLCALIAFYAMGWLRRLRWAESCFVLCCLMLSMVSSRTMSIVMLTWPQRWMFVALGLTLVVIGLVQRSTIRAVIGLLIALAPFCVKGWGAASLAVSSYYVLHMAVLAVLILGLLFDDELGCQIRKLATIAIPLAAVFAAVAYDFLFPDIPVAVNRFYVSCLASLALCYWLQIKHVRSLLSSLATISVLCFMQIRPMYDVLEQSRLGGGLQWLVFGLIMLLLGVAVSFAKAGFFNRLYQTLDHLNDRLHMGTND
ncbi:MAG: hypothetical protein WBF93_00925 [Pirellulales bacterium]